MAGVADGSGVGRMGAAGSAGTSRALLMARRPSWVRLDRKVRSSVAKLMDVVPSRADG